MQHTSQIRYIHSQLARNVPIGAFVELLDPASVGLTDKNQFYAPVRFSVQVCGGINAAAGAIRVDVPVHANPNWLEDMKERFAGMMGIESSIEFKTVDGKSLDDFPVDFLDMAGKLHVYVDGKEMRLDKLPEIPLEYQVDKENKVDAWYQKVTQELPGLLAGALVGKDINQVNAAIRGEGPIQDIIASEMRKAAAPLEWAEFARTHNINSPATIEAQEGSQILNEAAKEALLHVRKFIEVSAKQIGHYIAHEQNLKTKTRPDDIDAPVLGVSVSSSSSPGINGFEMYQKLMADAFATPVVQQAVVEKVYNIPIGDKGCAYRNKPRPREKKEGKREKKKSSKSVETGPNVENLVNKYTEGSVGNKFIPRGKTEHGEILQKIDNVITNLAANNVDKSQRTFDKLIAEFEKISNQYVVNEKAVEIISQNLGKLSISELEQVLEKELKSFEKKVKEITAGDVANLRKEFDEKMAQVNPPKPGFAKRFYGAKKATTGLFSSYSTGKEEESSGDEGGVTSVEEEQDDSSSGSGDESGSGSEEEKSAGKGGGGAGMESEELPVKASESGSSEEEAPQSPLQRPKTQQQPPPSVVKPATPPAKQKESPQKKKIEQIFSNSDLTDKNREMLVDFVVAYLEADTSDSKRVVIEQAFNTTKGVEPKENTFAKGNSAQATARWVAFLKAFNFKPNDSEIYGTTGRGKNQKDINPVDLSPNQRSEKRGEYLLKLHESGSLDKTIKQKLVTTKLANSRIGNDSKGNTLFAGIRKAQNQEIINKLFSRLPNSDKGEHLSLLSNFLLDYAQKANNQAAKELFVENAFSGTDGNETAFGGTFSYSADAIPYISTGLSRWIILKRVLNITKNDFPLDDETGTSPDDWERRKNFLLKNLDQILKNAGVRLATIGAHHPWNALIHHTLQPEAEDGTYPAYYNLLHTKQDMSAEAPFEGDVESTYAAHHLFSGAAPLPPAMKIAGTLTQKRAKMEPIGWGADADDREWEEAIVFAINQLEMNGKKTTRRKIWKVLAARNLEKGWPEPPDPEILYMYIRKLIRRNDLVERNDETLALSANTLDSDNIMNMQTKIKYELPKLIPLESNASIPPRPPLRKISSPIPLQDDNDLSLLREKMRARLVPIKSGLPKLIPIENVNYGLPSIFDDDF